ncbi:SusC/RagA family TonB-linked outer membrane protein [Hymenobacter psychrotolerans]|uniref:Iron complex outermembrane recepter protein n=1 Tax=Hymenobacter psychrotolerans DSM 18569 TaxID=1121959 RepID=A0A1M6VCD0_9BACT|nr:SusC/RagA family TonB-linked outer membrane protein [Hymenobacter psychrotolerans]SHK79034.1 iron complex outermembrane recepter protein [Hymenobacter psychrotolerans DSM 18569]
MKHPYLAKLLFLLLFVCAGFTAAFAQTGSVSGRVVDEKSEGLPGVTVLIEGTSLGNSTNSDGTYSIQNVPAGPRTLVVSFVGYTTSRIPVTVTAGQNTAVPGVTLNENTTLLNEAVVIGYGTQRRQDVTGSVTTVDSRQFVKGQITNPEQLVQGKVAGVQITTASGQPGAGASIRIRGGASLTASNDPLIVIDNVPVDNRGLSGTANPLSLINPNDIESVTVLKDASATAIYGSRASNGVILITTKKGVQGEKTTVNFSTQLSRAEAVKFVDVLNADEFRNLVNTRGNAQQKALLNTDSNANTDWQNEVYRTSWTSDNNLSITGSAGKVPYRASVGYLSQEGLLKNNNLKRNTASIGFSPLLFNDNLKIDVNIKGAWIDNNFSNQDAVGAAVFYDPTKTIRNGSPFGGFTEITKVDNGQTVLNTLATRNPVGLLEQKRDRSTVKRSIGNIQLDYKLPFLQGLRANLNLGYDIQRGRGTTLILPNAASNYNDQVNDASGNVISRGGQNNQYAQDKNNGILEAYLNYSKQMGNNRLDLLAGHSYQSFEDKNYVFSSNLADGTVLTAAPTLSSGKNFRDPRYVLISFFGRANYNINDKYLLTATMRADGSSRFKDDQRWGYFPSGAIAWRIKGEDFLKESTTISDLKLRAGVGQTGQQDIGGDLYPYLARYTLSEQTARYPFGDTYYNTLRAAAYYEPIKWETTTTYNLGLDYGFFDGRVYGAVDVYSRKTKDLLNNVFIPGGSNLSNKLTTNVGSLENQGIEASVNVDIIRGEKLNWTLNANATAYRIEITELTNSTDASYLGDAVGGITGGTGNNVQINSVGYTPNTFYVFKQVYGQDGKPLEGVYADLNGDGVVNDRDKYRYKSPVPRASLGFGSNLSYGKASLAFTLRANLGNYVYNNIRSRSFFPVGGSDGVINNTTREALDSGFGTPQYFSDYYVENASFLRMENLTVGYNVGNLYKETANLNLSLAVQNLFVITNYSGIDPEIVSFDTSGKVSNVGIDNVIYPRPRTITLGLNVSF